MLTSHFENDLNRPNLTGLLVKIVPARGIEVITATGDADAYIERCVA